MILARTVFFGVFNAWMHYCAILCIATQSTILGALTQPGKLELTFPKAKGVFNQRTQQLMSLQSVEIHLKTNAAFNSVALNCNVNTFVTQGLTACHMSFLAFLFYHILYCICFKILFTESKYLVSNWGYTHLISRTIQNFLKSQITTLRFFVIIILCNQQFILLKLLWAIKGFILYQINQTALKLS